MLSDSNEVAWAATALGATAAAAGGEVVFVAWFAALRALAAGRLGAGFPPEAPQPMEMLAQARALGARLIACETAVGLAGVVPTALAGTVELSTVLQIDRLSADALVLTF